MSAQYPQFNRPGDIQRSTEGPSAAEWEGKQEVIRDLYERKRLKLKDVRAILERDYGFKATYVLMRSVHSPVNLPA